MILCGCVYVPWVLSCSVCLTLWEGSLPGSSVHEILPTRILEWVAISSFRRSSRPRDQTQVSYISYIGRQVVCH